MRKPAEVYSRLLRRLGNDRHVQPVADDLGDLPEANALFSDAMIAGACLALLERQPVELGCIEPVHGGPEIAPLAGIDRNALLAGEADQQRDEAVIAVAMNRRRQADRDGAHTPRCGGSGGLFGGDAGRGGGRRILLGGQPAFREQPGS